MRTYILCTILFLSFTTELDAQRYRRYQRRHDRTQERIEEGVDKGKIDNDELAEIREREKKLQRANRRALRNGTVTDHEQNKMNRRLRRVKRETRRSGRD